MTGAASPHKIEAGSWVYDRDLDCLVPKNGRNFFDRDEKRADLPCPAVHSSGSGMGGGFKSMADGRFYETRRNYEKSVRRAGCEIVGHDDPSSYVAKPPSEKAVEAEIVADVKKAIQQEASKMPPAGGREDRKLMRKQRREARASKC